MGLPVWGNLDKSQIDNEKIEEAIARLIQAHEDDPNAHIETGESLQSHKASEVIDHIVSSIIADKIKDGEVVPIKIGMLIWNTHFESIDGYDKSAGVAMDIDGGFVELVTQPIVNDEQYIYKQLRYEPHSWNWDKDRTFETAIWLETVNDVLFQITTGGITFRPHIGFKIEDGFLYGTVGNNSVQTAIQLQAVSHSTRYQIKAHLIAGNRVDFYVDGDLKGTINTNLPSGILWVEFIIACHLQTKVAVDKEARFSYWDLRQAL